MYHTKWHADLESKCGKPFWRCAILPKFFKIFLRTIINCNVYSEMCNFVVFACPENFSAFYLGVYALSLLLLAKKGIAWIWLLGNEKKRWPSSRYDQDNTNILNTTLAETGALTNTTRRFQTGFQHSKTLRRPGQLSTEHGTKCHLDRGQVPRDLRVSQALSVLFEIYESL